MMRRLMLFDRFDGILGDMPEGEVRAISTQDVINGERSVTITTTHVLDKGERLLMRDGRGVWHEYVVYGIDEDHASGAATVGSYYCVWSLQHDLMGTRVSSMPGVQNPTTAALALDAALAGTSRWERGTVTNTATGGASMYDMDGWSALSVLVGTWGGELDATIEVGSTGVTARKVDLYAQMGESDATRRFDFGADVKGIRRSYGDGPLYCRITPRGKGEQTGDGYGRKVTIEDVNDGKDYLTNNAMVDVAKLPDGSGGWEYPTLEVENSSCETPADLLAWAQGVLEAYTTPSVSYSVDVMQLAQEGVDIQGVSLGDVVHVVDRKFGEDGLRLSARVQQVETDGMTGKVASVTLGSVREGLASQIGRINAVAKHLDEVQSSINTLATSDYVDDLIDRLNTQINATGGYWYMVPGYGTRTYDMEVSDPAVGDEASAVVEVRGGTIRIANSRTSGGDWDWKTVFTSGHILGELVTAAAITTGYIGSSGGTYIDLDSNTIQLGSDSMLHAKLDNNAFELWTPQGTYDSRSALHLGYGQVKSNYNVYVNGPYFTLGERDSSAEIGYYSYSEGEQHKVTRAYSHAEGYGHTISESYAHAEGSVNTVSGRFAHAEGSLNTASGNFSHVGGNGCTASGGCSFSMGVDAVASYDYSTAFGRNTQAQNTCQFVCGQYNTYDSGPFVVGWGGPYTSVGSRKNILTLAQGGGLWIAGSLTQNSDRRLKEHHAYLGDDACEFVRSLKPALFTKDGERHVGFYAQDVQSAEPDGWDTNTVKAKHTDESLDFDPLTLDYTALIAPLVTYAQSLEKKIETQQERIDALISRIEALEARA